MKITEQPRNARPSISQLLVVDGNCALVGALNTHDLMQARVI